MNIYSLITVCIKIYYYCYKKSKTITSIFTSLTILYKTKIKQRFLYFFIFFRIIYHLKKYNHADSGIQYILKTKLP